MKHHQDETSFRPGTAHCQAHPPHRLLPMNITFHAGILAVGSAGCKSLADVAAALPRSVTTAAIDTDTASLAACPAERKLLLGTAQPAPQAQVRHGVVPFPPCIVTLAMEEERTLQRQHRLAELRTSAEPHLAELQAWAAGLDVLFLLGGLGGMVGTTLLPLLAERLYSQQGVIPVVFTPFAFEAPWRHLFARDALTRMQQVEAVRALLELKGETADDLTQHRCHAAQFCRLIVESWQESSGPWEVAQWLDLIGKGGATLVQARAVSAEAATAAVQTRLGTAHRAHQGVRRVFGVIEGPGDRLRMHDAKRLQSMLAPLCDGPNDCLFYLLRPWPDGARADFCVSVLWREIIEKRPPSDQ